jgi:hypothetical protein
MKHSSLKASNSHHACTSLRCHRPCVAAYVLFWTSAIHVATGSLLVTEAGGVVSDIDGNAWNSDSIIASATAALHADLLTIATEPSREQTRKPINH